MMIWIPFSHSGTNLSLSFSFQIFQKHKVVQDGKRAMRTLSTSSHSLKSFESRPDQSLKTHLINAKMDVRLTIHYLYVSTLFHLTIFKLALNSDCFKTNDQSIWSLSFSGMSELLLFFFRDCKELSDSCQRLF